MTQAGSEQRAAARKSTTAAYFVVALVLLCILALLPFALTSVMKDLTEQVVPVYEINQAAAGQVVTADAHLQVVAVNEWDGTVSIRVAAHQSCDRTCPWGDRYLFTSVYGDTRAEDDDRPATEIVTLPATARDVTQVITLPVFGDPIRYPFDSYQLAIGVIVDRLLPDGSVQTLTAAEARQYLSISVQGRVPRATMSRPVPTDPATLDDSNRTQPFVTVQTVHFGRPLYIKVLTVLLILLVSAAAAYAVFMRPLSELIIGSGALILGVWGIRGITLGTGVQGFTAVDLALTSVILFLLATITVRLAWLLEADSAVKPIRGRLMGAATAKSSTGVDQAGPDAADFVPGREIEPSVNGAPEHASVPTPRGS